MIKAGLIIGGIMLVIGTVGAWFQPLLCVPCLALFAGIGGGYLAGTFDKPAANNLAVKNGAGAGAIGGIGALLAHLIGGTIVALTVGPQNAAIVSQYLGGGNPTDNPVAYWIGALGVSCCFGLFEVALLAGLGALGGLIWFQTAGKNAATPGMPGSAAGAM